MPVEEDIATLKEKVSSLHGAVNDVGSKMDVLLDLQIQLVTLQVQHDNTKDSLERAFNAIASTKDSVSGTTGRLDRTISFVRGGAIVATLLLSFGCWYIVQQINTLREVAQHADNFNLRLTLVERKVWPDKDHQAGP